MRGKRAGFNIRRMSDERFIVCGDVGVKNWKESLGGLWAYRSWGRTVERLFSLVRPAASSIML
jgi:hypothetical protein